MADDALREIEDRLQEDEYRREFGTANVKYDLAFALVDARKRMGLTQEQFAERARVSQAYIAKLESGGANPTVGHIGGMLAAIWLRPQFTFGPLVGQHLGLLSAAMEPRPSRYEDAVLDKLPGLQPQSSGISGSTSGGMEIVSASA